MLTSLVTSQIVRYSKYLPIPRPFHLFLPYRKSKRHPSFMSINRDSYVNAEMVAVCDEGHIKIQSQDRNVHEERN